MHTHTLDYFWSVKKKHFKTFICFWKNYFKRKEMHEITYSTVSSPWNSKWMRETDTSPWERSMQWLPGGWGILLVTEDIAVPWSDEPLLSHDAAGVNTNVQLSDFITYKLQVKKKCIMSYLKAKCICMYIHYFKRKFSVWKRLHTLHNSVLSGIDRRL